MSNRDDFSEPTKKQLAERAGYRCSFLGCGKPTIGPSDEKATASSSIGIAAHIAAAAPGKGARRYIAAMKPEERKDISNGIWMCEDHGKLVDTDETRFTIEILKKWKQIAEAVARTMVENNSEYSQALKAFQFSDFATNEVKIDGNGAENELIGNAMHDCCVYLSWGNDLTNAVRDFAIEYIRNAFIHGNANSVSFDVLNNRIVITDNGNEFNPKDLLKNKAMSGGAASINELIGKFGSNLVLTTGRKNGQNVSKIAILKKEEEIFELTPCCYSMARKDFWDGSFTFNIDETCNEVFIVLPIYTCPSDIGMISEKLFELEQKHEAITFISGHLSELVKSVIKHYVPTCHIIELYKK